MFPWTETYTDFNDVERTETFYFNLTEAEIAELELQTVGGLKDTLSAIIQAKDLPALSKLFKDVILRSYGIKTADGKRFQKSDEIRQSFMETQAYSNLYMKLASDDVFAAAFIKGIMPKDLANAVPSNLSSIPAPTNG